MNERSTGYATIRHFKSKLRVERLEDRATPAGFRVAAYYPEWATYARNYQVASIPADQITHLLYAFAKIDSGGGVAIYDTYAAVEKMFPGDTPNQPLRGNFNQLRILKEQNPHLKTLISVGGWTLSAGFSNAALTTQSRQHFAQTAVTFIRQYGFDGVSLDWEFPVSGGHPSNVSRPADRQNFTLLCQELRQQLNAAGTTDGKSYLLSAATAAGWQTMGNYELAAAAQSLDWLDVMTYDYHGSWENRTNHQAALHADPADPYSSQGRYNAAWTIQAYVNAGVPADKVLLGAPLYGKSWRGVPATNNGLYQTAAGAGPGTWEAGTLEYKDLYNRLQTQPATYQRTWDPVSGVPSIYAASVSGGTFSTYEDVQSIQGKIDYVRQNNLGGMFFWELSGDLPATNADSLVRRAAEGLLTAHVQSVRVNDGAAQRSRVTNLTVTLDRQVTLPTNPAAAFTLTRIGGGNVAFTASVSVVNGQSVITLGNFNGPETAAGSLRDGRYTLTALASQITTPAGPLNGGLDYTFGDAQGLFRYFGDSNGDRRIDISDFGPFLATYNRLSTDPLFNPIFDFNGDGRIDIIDFGQFSVRFFTTLP